MDSKLLFRSGVTLIFFLLVHFTLAFQQHRLQRKLDELDMKIQEENLLRRKEIHTIYIILERIEERLNLTLGNINEAVDKPSEMEPSTAGKINGGDDRVKDVLTEFMYLKRGFRDEKRHTSRLRRQVAELNVTVSQFIYQNSVKTEQSLHDIGEIKHTLSETRNISTVVNSSDQKAFARRLRGVLKLS